MFRARPIGGAAGRQAEHQGQYSPQSPGPPKSPRPHEWSTRNKRRNPNPELNRPAGGGGLRACWECGYSSLAVLLYFIDLKADSAVASLRAGPDMHLHPKRFMALVAHVPHVL